MYKILHLCTRKQEASPHPKWVNAPDSNCSSSSAFNTAHTVSSKDRRYGTNMLTIQLSRSNTPVGDIQVESGAFTHFGCGDTACFPVHNWRILHTQMKAQCIRYTATDFHVDRFSRVFENQLQSWWTDFGLLPPSSPLSETAEASGVILQLRHTCVSHSAMTQ